MNIKRYQVILAFIAFIALAGIVGQSDFEEEQRQQDEYCAMVKIWNEDKARGVPEHDRAGWPPFEGEEQCRVH